MDGIATTITSWSASTMHATLPPRATVTRLNRGATLGEPHDVAQQRRVLEATLALLAQDAPVEILRLKERAKE
jgi:hypothetical protein